MADDKCVEAVEGEVTKTGQDSPCPSSTPPLRPVFLVPALDDPQQRQQVLAKVKEFLASEYPESPGPVTYAAQVGWEEVEQAHSLTSHLLSACRTHHLLPSERCILLSLQDQYQAIQLCLARINKQRRGEFMAAASDVLDVWNALYKETVGAGEREAGGGHKEDEGETDTLEELNHLRASQDSHDPMQREMEEVKKAYRDFLSDSLCLDHFRVFECLRSLLRDDPALFRKVFCKVYIIEGLEELPLMERALLKLISKDSRVYRVTTELPLTDSTPRSPSALDISGIHETTILQTPCRHEEKQTNQRDEVAQDSQDTVIPQTPSQSREMTADDENETATPRKRAPTTEEDDGKNTDIADKVTSQEESKDIKEEHTGAGTQEEREKCEDTTTTTKPSAHEGNGDNLSTSRNTEEKMETKNNTKTPAKPAAPEGNSDTKNLCTPRNTGGQTQSENSNIHTPAKPRAQPSTMAIQVEGVEESLVEVVNGAPRHPTRAMVTSESEAYVERLFLAHVRLMINTRDELALTLACSMPGREITQQGFTDIRQEAQRKEMPMYQTIVSFILRQRLGGKGYQPEPNNPVLAHSKPLGEFVDALMKLQSTLEAQADPRQGAARVLCGIKSSLGKMKGCMLKRRMIEAVADHLCAALDHLVEAAERDKKASTDKDAPECAKPSKLQPALKHLIHLCDVAGGQAYSGGVVDALGGDLLSQLSSSKKTTKTPLKVPSVLTLFRSPAVIHEKGEEEEEEEGDLETRLKRKMGKPVTAPAQPKRFKSACSWAPIDMSPIDADKLNLSFSSPITGPSLKVTGKAAKRPSEDWREIVAEVTQEEESVPTSSKTASPAPKASKPDKEIKPKKSKRSLLKDISNMGTEDEETKSKKRPAAEKGAKKKEPKTKESKTKPLLKGQRTITSFFKV